MNTLITHVKSSPDTLFQELSGEAVLLNLKTERYYGLDEVGMRMYQLLVENGNPELAVEKLLSEYEVDENTLRKDLTNLITQLNEQGLIIIK
ncbi:MAG: PqqD family protein [Desulfamplus sp.]|nr:PqqD family protein [Desulfamplus sp.]